MNVATGIIPLGAMGNLSSEYRRQLLLKFQEQGRMSAREIGSADRETVYSSDPLAQGAILVEKALDSFSQFHEAVKV
jgi:hypothetical protein